MNIFHPSFKNASGSVTEERKSDAGQTDAAVVLTHASGRKLTGLKTFKMICRLKIYDMDWF